MGPKVGGSGVRETPGRREQLLARLMETQIQCLPVPAGGGLSKGTIASAGPFVSEKAARPPAPKPDNAVPPSLTQAPFELLSQGWMPE